MDCDDKKEYICEYKIDKSHIDLDLLCETGEDFDDEITEDEEIATEFVHMLFKGGENFDEEKIAEDQALATKFVHMLFTGKE